MKLRLQTPLLVLLCLLGVALPAMPRQADDARPAPVPALRLIALELAVGDAVPPDLQCQPRATPPPATAASAAAPLTEIPDPQEVEAALAVAEPASAPPAAGPHTTRLPLPGNGAAYRVAVWGDSHMAAAFFTDALAHILAPALGLASARFVPAGVGHAGVRGLVRKVCLSSGWTRETAHARSAAAQAPGPGLVSLLAQEPGASVALDLRDVAGQPRHRAVQILFGPMAQAVTVALSVNDGDETTLVLPATATATASAAAIDLHTNATLSTLKLRLLQGALRLQGLRLGEAPAPTGLQLDVLAYPGATALGWARADLGLLRAWFDGEPYDLVLLAYGTNEGNDPHYDASAYREMLLRAVGQMRQVFPQARCLLLGPGDRGVRVAKSRSKFRKPARKPATNTAAARAAAHKAAAARVDLLKYARIHEEINRIQQAVAAQQGCSAWDMQARMGGRGAAYKWARTNPALMAPDLIHFTAAGYRELAQRFAADVGWSDR